MAHSLLVLNRGRGFKSHFRQNIFPPKYRNNMTHITISWNWYDLTLMKTFCGHLTDINWCDSPRQLIRGRLLTNISHSRNSELEIPFHANFRGRAENVQCNWNGNDDGNDDGIEETCVNHKQKINIQSEAEIDNESGLNAQINGSGHHLSIRRITIRAAVMTPTELINWKTVAIIWIGRAGRIHSGCRMTRQQITISKQC